MSTVKNQIRRYRLVDEYLDTISNTCLIFNSKTELGDAIGYPSVASNNKLSDIRDVIRKESILSRLKDYSRDICSDSDFDLESLLEDYKQASEYYREHLSRSHVISQERSQNILYIVDHIYGNHTRKNDDRGKLSALCNSIYDYEHEYEMIPVSILILLILKIIPPYTAHEGNISNEEIKDEFHRAVLFLREATWESTHIKIEAIDLLEKASTSHKTCNRLYLIYSFEGILLYFQSLFSPEASKANIEEQFKDIIPFDWNGFFQENNSQTIFYTLKETHLIKYHFNSENKEVRYIDFRIHLFSDGEMNEAVVQHPNYFPHYLHGKYEPNLKLCCSFTVDTCDEEQNDSFITLHPYRSCSWFKELRLNRVTDMDKERFFKSILSGNDYHLINQFDDSVVESTPLDVYAVTRNGVYIDFSNDDEVSYLKVSFDTFPILQKATLETLCCLHEHNEELFLEFCMEGIYINITSEEELDKNGVQLVNYIT